MRVRAAALALAGGLIFTACGDGDPDAEFSTDDPAQSDGDSKPGKDEQTSSDGTKDVIGVTFPDADDVVAEATFTIPGTDDEVTVGIAGLFAHEKYTELRLVVTPLFDGDGTPSVYDALENGTGVVPVTLIDRENLKQYVVLDDGAPYRYETDPSDAETEPGEPVGYQRFFAPPEDDIDVIDVSISASWPVFEDVPITYVD